MVNLAMFCDAAHESASEAHRPYKAVTAVSCWLAMLIEVMDEARRSIKESDHGQPDWTKISH